MAVTRSVLFNLTLLDAKHFMFGFCALFMKLQIQTNMTLSQVINCYFGISKSFGTEISWLLIALLISACKITRQDWILFCQ